LSSTIDHQFVDDEPVCTIPMNRAVCDGKTIVMIPVAPVPFATGDPHV
jgi:hypothetical protein